MAVKSSRWLKLFQDFIADIRISSKESISQDERGSKLELWESQRRFIHEVGTGLDKVYPAAGHPENTCYPIIQIVVVHF